MNNMLSMPVGMPVTVNYINWKFEHSVRTIVPYRLWYGTSIYHKDEQWFLLALDCVKNESRDFAVKDMTPYDWSKT